MKIVINGYIPGWSASTVDSELSYVWVSQYLPCKHHNAELGQAASAVLSERSDQRRWAQAGR